jgi:hypothetical protein
MTLVAVQGAAATVLSVDDIAPTAVGDKNWCRHIDWDVQKTGVSCRNTADIDSQKRGMLSSTSGQVGPQLLMKHLVVPEQNTRERRSRGGRLRLARRLIGWARSTDKGGKLFKQRRAPHERVSTEGVIANTGPVGTSHLQKQPMKLGHGTSSIVREVNIFRYRIPARHHKLS